MIHLRVVSPPDVTGTLMPMLHSEPAVLNLTMLPGAVSHPDGDAVHFDVLHGAANEVIGCLRDLGLEQRGSIVMENVAPRSPRTPTAPRPAKGGSSSSHPSGRRLSPSGCLVAVGQPRDRGIAADGRAL